MFWRRWRKVMTTDAGNGTTDITEAVDWHGKAVECDSCPHRELRAEGKCRLGAACLQDRYAKRIDRFFKWNPDLANAYLMHPYFEVRAVAAKYAELVLLPHLLGDPDETVRSSAILRLPQRYLLRAIHDPHREVRIRVAARLDPADLLLMMKDADYYVRQTVARRLPERLLRLMVNDSEPEVRRIVATRIDPSLLAPFTRDSDATVRLRAVERLPSSQLVDFDCDPDWRVRYEAARRMRLEFLGAMTHDSDELVRELARKRLETAREKALVAGTKEVDS
jgi:hypothetical protein